MALLALLMVVLVTMLDATTATWKRSSSKIEQFQQGWEAFDRMARQIAEATLNTYYDYVDANGNPRTTATSLTFVPKQYRRQSELRFISGPGLATSSGNTTHAVFFQAPQGKSTGNSAGENLLNTCGFFVELGSDQSFLPQVLPASFSKNRFRLLQLVEPSESLSVYGRVAAAASGSIYTGREWFQDALNTPANVSIAAENIIALVVLPMLTKPDQISGGYSESSLAPEYLYDSSRSYANASAPNAALNSLHQLPPVIQTTMVAIDEASASRMSDADRNSLKTFLNGLFLQSGNTTDPTQPGYAKDLKSLEDELVKRKINYRIFTSNIPIKSAKWSREQK